MQSFRDQFISLNEAMRQALTDRDFDRACNLDAQRRDLLVDMMSRPAPEDAAEILDFIEACAAENAALCADLEHELGALARHAGKSQKMMRAYGR